MKKKFSVVAIITVVVVLLILIFINFINRKTQYNQFNIDQDSILNSKTTYKFYKDTSWVNWYNVECVILVFQDSSKVNLLDFPSKECPICRDTRNYYFKDIDNDNELELIIHYFSGGAHCCIVNYIFRRTRENEFTEIFRYTGGSPLKIVKNNITADFSEQVGYFFTCFACSIKDSLPNYFFRPEINLKYENKKIILALTDSVFNERILENLTYLKNRPVPSLDEYGMDDGTRKAYAQLLIAYCYNNQANIDLTKSLFDNYYMSTDREIVWEKIEAHIDNIYDMHYSLVQFAIDVIKILNVESR